MKFKEHKTMILGINGSGKTEFGKFFVGKVFKRVVWVIVNNDDLKGMPKNVTAVLSINRENRTAELNEILGDVIELAKQGKVDAVVIDEADIFINDNEDIKKFSNINDMVILQRHHGLGVFIMSRRPASLPTMLFETSDNIIAFASPVTDNTKRKFGSIHKNLPDMIRKLKKGDYKFVSFTLGEEPKFNNPIPLGNKTTKQKGKKENDKTRSEKVDADDENQGGRE